MIGLDVGTMNGKATLAEHKSLVKNKEGPPVHGEFSYPCVVEMMLYLAVHSRPDVAYAMKCAVCYIFYHEKALKHIERYIEPGVEPNHL